MPAPRVTSKTPWHILLLLDDSGSMQGTASADVNDSIRELIDSLVTASMGMKPYFRVSVVSFGTHVRTLTEAQPESALDEDVVANFDGGSGSTNIAGALDEAARILGSHPGKETDFEPFVFLLSDGQPDDRTQAVAASERLKQLKHPAGRIRIVTLGFGDVDDTLMAEVASQQELYKKVATSKDIIKLLPPIGTMTAVAGGAEGVEKAIMNL